MRRSVVVLGVGTAKDIADYYRLPVATTKSRLRELATEGVVEPVRVEGWKDPAWLNPTAKVPLTCEAHALLSPFDSVIWERKRAERIFDFIRCPSRSMCRRRGGGTGITCWRF